MAGTGKTAWNSGVPGAMKLAKRSAAELMGEGAEPVLRITTRTGYDVPGLNESVGVDATDATVRLGNPPATRTSEVSARPPSDATIRALPFEMPVTEPVLSTVATVCWSETKIGRPLTIGIP